MIPQRLNNLREGAHRSIWWIEMKWRKNLRIPILCMMNWSLTTTAPIIALRSIHTSSVI